jgi:hypothetical protein
MNLEDLKVASPCHEPWDRMTGDERARHCAKCDLCVYNISDMTRQEALDFIGARQGVKRTCIRMLRRFDGTVITRDCPVGVRKRRLTLLGLAAGGVATAVAGVAAVLAYKPSGKGGGIVREAYDHTRAQVLSTCDDISHKFDIPSLCNCPTGFITMGVMVAPGPPHGAPGPMPAGVDDPPPELPVETPDEPPADPFAEPGKE